MTLPGSNAESGPGRADHGTPVKKRILVVTTRYPFPPIGGDKLRIAQLCEILSEEYEVHLAALSERATVEPPRNDLGLSSTRVFHQSRLLSWLLSMVGLVSSQPIQSWYHFNPRLYFFVRRHAERFDALVFHLARSAVYRPPTYQGPTLLEMTDCMSRHYERASGYVWNTWLGVLYGLVERTRMRRFERKVSPRFDAVTVVSDAERDALVALDARYREKTHVFPNYVRRLHYRPTRPERDTLLFIGNMTALHEFDAVHFFAHQIVPRLVARRPGLRLLVVGAIRPRSARLLRRQPNVDVSGPLQALEERLDGLLCGVAPMRFASGIQNKVIDYMSLGIPALVSAPALEGIPAREGEEVLICRNPHDYVRAVDHLLSDERSWQRLGKQGQAFVNRTYRREEVAVMVLTMLRPLLGDRERTSPLGTIQRGGAVRRSHSADPSTVAGVRPPSSRSPRARASGSRKGAPGAM